VTWGLGVDFQCSVPSLPSGVSYVQVGAGLYHTIALRSDGKVQAWGSNSYGQCQVPPLTGGLVYVEIAAGDIHNLGRLSDGSVVAWGGNFSGQCNVPALPAGLTYVGIAAGSYHSFGLRSDGSVVAWADNSNGQCNVPALPAGLSYVEIAAGHEHSVARRSDGSVVGWGKNDYGQCSPPALPAGVTYVEIAAGDYHTVARRSDGSIVGWGMNDYGQCATHSPPPGLAYVQIAAGGTYTAARRSDGSFEGWGDQTYAHALPALPVGLAYVDLALHASETVASFDVVPTAFCFGDGTGAQCPCSNEGAPGHGCDNSSATGGAILTASGTASRSNDALVLTCTGTRNGVLTVMLQGRTSVAATNYGDGLRCISGSLKRLYAKIAQNGAITVPGAGDPSVTARSSALGDTIPAGATRYYQAFYRDSVASFCPNPPGNAWNISSGQAIAWQD
jgi:hypothetical protein